MKLLINKKDCNAHLGVSFHRNNDDFERFVRQAQIFDLKPLMCEDFFADLTSTTPKRNYETLLNGGSYTHKGRNYHFEGLKAVISYFSFARYLLLGHQTDTPFGVKEKNYSDGLQISNTERRDTKTMYVQNAHILWEDCQKYIERNPADFPEWDACNSGCSPNETKTKKFKFSLI